MTLDPDDAERFFRLHKALTLFVNRRLKIVELPAESSKAIIALPPAHRLKVRDALVEHLDLIDAFVEENPYKLDPDELEIVQSWRDLVAGDFFVLRHLKNYTVFLTAKEPSVAYGVVGLGDPLSEVIQQPLPFYCRTVLLPFRGKIVYDGLLWGYNILIGPNMRRDLNATYNAAKKRYGIVTSLPWHPARPPASAKEDAAQKKRGKRENGLTGRWRIVSMSQWEDEYLDEEVEAYMEFNDRGGGSFQFGYVQGVMDWREGQRDGQPRAEFSWEGGDAADGTPLTGRGWAVRGGDELRGKILIHLGDESDFVAKRKGTARRRKRT